MTQNAAHFATSAAKMTATSAARPPTATATPPPTAVPTEEVLGVLAEGGLVHLAGVRTGLEEVDPIIDTVLAGDLNAFRQQVQFTISNCTQEMALGGPPKCREGESDGTRVEVLPFMGPEGHFLRRDEMNSWQGIDAVGLFAVYRVSEEAFSSEDYPGGEYGIVFRTRDPNVLVTLRVENGWVVRVDSAFGTPPEIDFGRVAQEMILLPPNTIQ
jgi:hypothetical protein